MKAEKKGTKTMNTKTTKQIETTATLGLREKIQSLREKAREILRMKLISGLLQDLFFEEKYIKESEKSVGDAKLATSRAKYKLENLDESDPDFETKKKDSEAVLERSVSYEAETIKNANDNIALAHKAIERINRNISEIEEGKIKVAIEEVKNLTDKMIGESL